MTGNESILLLISSFKKHLYSPMDTDTNTGVHILIQCSFSKFLEPQAVIQVVQSIIPHVARNKSNYLHHEEPD